MTMKTLAVAVGVAAALAAGSANAGFYYSDTVAPAASTLPVPASNDFRSQLASAGVTTETYGASLALNAPGSITIDYFAKEAVYTNSFRWYGAVIGTTPSGSTVDGWNQRTLGTFGNVGAGVLDFAFCTSGGPGMGTPGMVPGGCVTNAQEDGLTLGAMQGITFYISADGNTAWAMWDDGGGGPDDNHDDMIVRMRYSVPEPGTLGLLGLGLLATGVAARRKRLG